MTRYEDLLNANPELALREGGAHFGGESAVHSALRRVTARLDELGIPYALAGGMALFLQGYRRFTEDVDILVTPAGLARVQQELEERGYRPVFAGSRTLREVETGVRIEFLVSGEFPGDGKPKPLAFPEPEIAAEVVSGIRCLRLAHLIELKLESGSTPGRLRDLADVQELIKTLQLREDYAETLHASVRERYRELWTGLQGLPPER